MWRKILIGLTVFIVLGFISIPLYERITGASVAVRFGAIFWIPVSAQSPFISKGVRAGLSDPISEVSVGPMTWHTVQAGFETAELPVMASDEEVDRILLARIDPRHFRFTVHNEPSGLRQIGDWQRHTGAALIVNGSYYGRDGLPSTPTISEGTTLGPRDYDADHGAFVAGTSGTHLVDLAGLDWKEVLADKPNAFVSYPLLIAPDGSMRTPQDSNWLANRSFLARDKAGRILVGTTSDGFFSLHRLAEFLKSAPLEIETALNLDGGPVACQSIDLGGFKRQHCGNWELQVKDGKAKMLPPFFRLRDPSMPIAIAVYPK